MKVYVQLILIVCIVNFGLTTVQLLNQKGNQAVPNEVDDDDRKIRKNYQNLFDSIAKNDEKNGIIYSKILEDEVVRERQTFDAMKEDLRMIRKKNFIKSHFLKKRNMITEDNRLVKRETRETHGNYHNAVKRNPPLPRPLREPADDTEYTENIYFNCTDFTPDPNTTFGRRLDVCGMSKKEYKDLCSTILGRKKFKDYSLLPDEEAEDCTALDVMILFRFYITLFLYDAEVRKCPTKPPLYLMSGHGKASVFLLGLVVHDIDGVLEFLYVY